MKLIIKRITTIIYQSDSLLELEIDPLSLSGIDYWSQEARSAKVTLLMDNTLQSILVGSLREVKAGFHTFIALVYHGTNLLYSGVVADGAHEVSYHTRSQKTVSLEITCFLGLLLKLAESRLFELKSSSVNPVACIPALIASVLYPSQDEPDPDDFSNADILHLIHCVGPINYQYAHLTYNPDAWVPLSIIDHLLIDARSIRLFHPDYPFTSQVFGFVQEDLDIYLVYWEFYSKTGHGSWDQKFRYRKYHLDTTKVNLIESIDESNSEPGTHLIHPPAPDVAQFSWGIGSYKIHDHKALYSGPVSLDSVDVVPGSYNVKDLLGEFLRLANAVLIADRYSFQVKCRLDLDRPVFSLSDPISAEFQKADNSCPELSPVAVASLSVLNSITRHYKSVLSSRPLEFSIKTHVLAPDFTAMNLPNPLDLVFTALRFDSYTIVPSSVAFDPVSGEIDISGRGALCVS